MIIKFMRISKAEKDGYVVVVDAQKFLSFWRNTTNPTQIEFANGNPAIWKKDRKFHYHHAIDAIVLTCMDKSIRDGLAEAFKESEENRYQDKFKIAKPWQTFTEDVNHLKENIIVVHTHKNNIEKQTVRKLRKRNKIQYDKKGNVIFEKGQGIRASLHKDTFYGKIEREKT